MCSGKLSRHRPASARVTGERECARGSEGNRYITLKCIPCPYFFPLFFLLFSSTNNIITISASSFLSSHSLVRSRVYRAPFARRILVQHVLHNSSRNTCVRCIYRRFAGRVSFCNYYPLIGRFIDRRRPFEGVLIVVFFLSSGTRTFL